MEKYFDVFESLVNLEGCKTIEDGTIPDDGFESLVNLEGCKTVLCPQEKV